MMTLERVRRAQARVERLAAGDSGDLKLLGKVYLLAPIEY